MQEDARLIVCPNSRKMDILNEICHDNSLHNVKFMTLEEFKNNYFFSYDERAIYYLMNKYGYNLDVCKVYLNNLYVIDTDVCYKDSKLNFLKDLKKELIDKDLLNFNYAFKGYLSKFKLEVDNYFDLDKYEEKALNYKFDVDGSFINQPVYEFDTLEGEVNFVCLKIIELLKSGVDINNIYLTNVSSDYLYTIRKLFSYYNIPVNLNFKDSIYGTKVVQDYLNNGTINLDYNDNNIINKKLVSILASLSKIEKNNLIVYNKILVDKLKNTYFSPCKLSNAVEVKNLFDTKFNDNDYVFVLGFNQDSLPKMEKDISFISDSIKDEVEMYSTSYLNARNKKIVSYLLSRIKNLYLSYKLSSPFSSFYKSSLISDLDLEVVRDNLDNYSYSNMYNMVRLGEKLDLFYLYGEESNYLKELNSHYSIPYKTYSNRFTGINNDLYLKHLSYPLKLSYTALNGYNECNFKYYIRNVLKIEEYEDNFSAYIGLIYHHILSLSYNEGFDFETEYNNYLKERDLNLKEKLLLLKIKKDLIKLLDVLKQQQLLTGYDNFFFEKYVEVKVRDDISVIFNGYIDKIMYYKEMEDAYFSIVDYKSGTIDTHIEPMKYGLHMQLPVYLYLIHYSKVFSNPIFTGIYYQNILFNYPTWSPKPDNDRYLLNGYSTDNIDILARFDSTYENSELIKSMKYKDDKFGAYAKVISDDDVYNLVKFTKRHIEEKTDDILNCKFSINPKVYSSKNVSCEFCSFKDLCFMKDKDLVYLPKVEDLSFLGGEE